MPYHHDIAHYVDEEHMRLFNMDTDSMDDEELREWHHKVCTKQPDRLEWSHAFDIYDCDEDDGQTLCSIAYPNRRVVKLFTKENWQKMGTTINENEDWGTDLGSIDLRNCGLNEEYVEMIFGCGRKCAFPLHRLHLSENRFGARGIAALLPFLKSVKKLDMLNLDNTGLGIEGMRLLSEVLDYIRIGSLSIQGNFIGDDGVESLLLTANARHLVKLYLEDNVIGRRGFEAMSRFLGRDDTALKKLTLQCDLGSHAKMVVESISNKSKLEELVFFDMDGRVVLAPEALPSLQHLICNRSSFESLCQSNHNLRSIGETKMSSMTQARKTLDPHTILAEALEMNGRAQYGTSVGRIMKSKLRYFYVNQSSPTTEKCSFKLQTFQEMDVVLMPFALELVARTDGTDNDREYYDLCFGCLNDIYYMIRNCHLPELFSFPSPETKTRQLEAKIAALEMESEQKMRQLKARIAALEIENEQLRIANSSLPNKRVKQ